MFSFVSRRRHPLLSAPNPWLRPHGHSSLTSQPASDVEAVLYFRRKVKRIFGTNCQTDRKHNKVNKAAQDKELMELAPWIPAGLYGVLPPDVGPVFSPSLRLFLTSLVAWWTSSDLWRHCLPTRQQKQNI